MFQLFLGQSQADEERAVIKIGENLSPLCCSRLIAVQVAALCSRCSMWSVLLKKMCSTCVPSRWQDSNGFRKGCLLEATVRGTCIRKEAPQIGFGAAGSGICLKLIQFPRGVGAPAFFFVLLSLQ